MAKQFKKGDSCYLREDYREEGVSEVFNILCKIVEIIPTSVTHEEINLTKSSGFVVQIERDDNLETETVEATSLLLREE